MRLSQNMIHLTVGIGLTVYEGTNVRVGNLFRHSAVDTGSKWGFVGNGIILEKCRSL
jgi:hypothetical protein